MTREQIIEELQTIKDYFTENTGAYPLALEEAQRALNHGISSRYVYAMTYYDDIDLESINYDESLIEWENLKNFDLDDKWELNDFMDMIQLKYGKADGYTVLWDLFNEGYYIDLIERLKLIANWI